MKIVFALAFVIYCYVVLGSEYNCTDLPVSMNGVAFGDYSYGCPGARWMNGEFSEKYCKGKDSDGNEGVYPWWSTCCDWENNECIAKGYTCGGFNSDDCIAEYNNAVTNGQLDAFY